MQHNITHGILKEASFNHSGGTHDQLVHLFFPKKKKKRKQVHSHLINS